MSCFTQFVAENSNGQIVEREKNIDSAKNINKSVKISSLLDELVSDGKVMAKCSQLPSLRR